jgi:hypothetical protein
MERESYLRMGRSGRGLKQMENLDRASGQLERLLGHREAIKSGQPQRPPRNKQAQAQSAVDLVAFGRSELHCEHEETPI